MKKIGAYKTNDGKLFENKEEALKHEVYSELEKALVDPSHRNLPPNYQNASLSFVAENFRKVYQVIAEVMNRPDSIG